MRTIKAVKREESGFEEGDENHKGSNKRGKWFQ